MPRGHPEQLSEAENQTSCSAIVCSSQCGRNPIPCQAFEEWEEAKPCTPGNRHETCRKLEEADGLPLWPDGFVCAVSTPGHTVRYGLEFRCEEQQGALRSPRDLQTFQLAKPC